MNVRAFGTWLKPVTRTIIVATAIVNMWTNDAATIARSYQRIAAKHSDRFRLGVGIGHAESIPRTRIRWK
jgi:alkanesulfonate monooxygenase SsuD/methylene tetrahydromethanopterin reductase-like flavin-dependent oxidoreductase (luciferase family)